MEVRVPGLASQLCSPVPRPSKDLVAYPHWDRAWPARDGAPFIQGPAADPFSHPPG